MNIEKIILKNYKGFRNFNLGFSKGINILVGNNGEGKSTILEAINLGLSGIIEGRYLKNDLNQYIFNKESVDEYLESLKGNPKPLPSILIELYFKCDTEEELAEFKGNNNSLKEDTRGLSFKIKFDEEYKKEYEELLKRKQEILTLPIEYYSIEWKSFGRDSLTQRSIPLKSVLIDSASAKYKNGSDVYISRILNNNLQSDDRVSLLQAFRQMKEEFKTNGAIGEINNKINDKDTKNRLEISIDLSNRSAIENLMTYLNDIPFHHLGKGQQSIIKTNLALSHNITKEAQLLLIEEPENHLSHTKLNELMKLISDETKDKQVIIVTHSNFVANKLGLEHLILLNKEKVIKLTNLTPDTYKFFKRIPGYDTLRLVLSEKAVLVEGDSDELIFQKAYMKENNGKLPIEDGIDVISCKLSFKRFLEIASPLEKKVCVITDNDGDYNKNILKKYSNYIDKSNIKISGSEENNYNTLEPQLIAVNDIQKISDVVRGVKAKGDLFNSLSKYMQDNKTEVALKIFETKEEIVFPDYIIKVVKWCKDE